MLSYWGLMTAALTAVMVALALMGPALLPPSWLSGQLAVMAALSFVLGRVARAATGRWWLALLWVAWVLTAVQWGWSAGEQPSGLPYWLAGMLLGGIGAALGRPRPASVTSKRVVKREAPQSEEDVEEAELWTDEPLTPDSWTTPLSAPTPPQKPVQAAASAYAAQVSQSRSTPNQSPLLPSQPMQPVEGTQVQTRPAWAADIPPKPGVRTVSPQFQPEPTTWGTASLWDQAQPSGQSPAVPTWATLQQAAEQPADQAVHDWQGRTWWDLEDELDTVDEAEWAAAEAMLRQQRETETGHLQSSRASLGQISSGSGERGQRAPQPRRVVQHSWEDIEDRE